jgi:hypothetical protein
MAEKVISLKYVDPNGSKAVTALRPREGLHTRIPIGTFP